MSEPHSTKILCDNGTWLWQDLGLDVGRDALVLVKVNFIMLATPGEGLRISARNRIKGVLARCDVEGVTAHAAINIGGGRTLTASVTAEAIEVLGIREGAPVEAIFDPSHVILAVD